MIKINLDKIAGSEKTCAHFDKVELSNVKKLHYYMFMKIPVLETPTTYTVIKPLSKDITITAWLSIYLNNWQVEQKPGGRGREWATLGVHPLSWLLSNNRLEKVPFVSVPHTSFNRLLLSNQDKGCTPSVAHSLALPLGPALLNLWNIK